MEARLSSAFAHAVHGCCVRKGGNYFVHDAWRLGRLCTPYRTAQTSSEYTLIISLSHVVTPCPSLATAASGFYVEVSSRRQTMTSQYRLERERGTKEFKKQLVVLREKWPVAFPAKNHDVRPLAIGAAREIAATTGWSLPYALGVLHAWKRVPIYSQGVLRYDRRINLDGSPAEEVGAEAKDQATKQLARLSARKVSKSDATAAAPAVIAPQPPPASRIETPAATPEQLRARVRASLLRRSA